MSKLGVAIFEYKKKLEYGDPISDIQSMCISLGIPIEQLHSGVITISDFKDDPTKTLYVVIASDSVALSEFYGTTINKAIAREEEKGITVTAVTSIMDVLKGFMDSMDGEDAVLAFRKHYGI